MSWAREATDRIRDAGLRAGAGRTAVVEAIASAQRGLTAAEVCARATTPRGAVSRATAYRILTELTSLGLLHRVELAGESCFEPVRADGHHEHHLVCDGCGRTERFSDEPLERAIHAAEHRLGFAAHAHDVVLHGRCAGCREPRAPDAVG